MIGMRSTPCYRCSTKKFPVILPTGYKLVGETQLNTQAPHVWVVLNKVTVQTDARLYDVQITCARGKSIFEATATWKLNLPFENELCKFAAVTHSESKQMRSGSTQKQRIAPYSCHCDEALDSQVFVIYKKTSEEYIKEDFGRLEPFVSHVKDGGIEVSQTPLVAHFKKWKQKMTNF